MVIVSITTAFIIVLLIPEEALAWGPATHLQLGWHILYNLKYLYAPIKSLIEEYPYDYLYGCISADIVVGKRFSRELNHCHNWQVGFRVLKMAEKPSMQSFAYGYLSHLAADTVSHNYFIPEKMLKTFSTRILRHVYWEMRFDSLMDRLVWDIPYEIMKGVRKDNDPLLEKVLDDTLLSFRTNRAIFKNVLLIHRMEQWHKMINRLSTQSRWLLGKEEKDRYYLMSFSAILDLLYNGNMAHCISEDPTGRESLMLAKKLRRDLRIKRKAGLYDNKDLELALLKIRNNKNEIDTPAKDSQAVILNTHQST